MIGSIPPRPSGRSAQARFVQWVWDSLAFSRAQEVPDALVNNTTRGLAIIPQQIAAAGGGGGKVQQLRLVRVEADYLVCHKLKFTRNEADTDWDTTEGTTNVFVAKPWAHRKTPFDTFTFNWDKEVWNGSSISILTLTLTFDYKSSTLRLVTDSDSKSEFQVLIPRYKPGAANPADNTPGDVFDTVYAVNCSGLDIRTKHTETVVAERDVVIKLLDTNADGRAWMRADQQS